MIERDDVDVVVLAVHGVDGRTVTTDLVKSGVVYGSRVQIFDPALSMIAALGNSGVDLASFTESGDAESGVALARSLVALDELDIETLGGLAECGLVTLAEPLLRDEIGTGRSVELFLHRFAALVNGPRGFVMLDRHAGRVFAELRAAGDFVIEPGATRRSHEASTANGLLGHLPNFRTARSRMCSASASRYRMRCRNFVAGWPRLQQRLRRTWELQPPSTRSMRRGGPSSHRPCERSKS